MITAGPFHSILLRATEMPPKRARKKVSTTKAETAVDDDEGVQGSLDYKVFSHPALQLQKIIDRGCAATVSDLQAEFLSASDWLYNQKEKLKAIIKLSSRNVPKTPRRGKTFSEFRENVENYSRSIAWSDDDDDDEDEIHDPQGAGDNQHVNDVCEDEVVENPCAAGDNFEAQNERRLLEEQVHVEDEAGQESSYEDAQCSMGTQRCASKNDDEPLLTPQNRPEQGSPQESEQYTSVQEISSNLLPRADVKMECSTPPMPNVEPVAPPTEKLDSTPKTSVSVKQEVITPMQSQPTRNTPYVTPAVATCDRVKNDFTLHRSGIPRITRSTTRARMNIVVASATQANTRAPTTPSRLRPDSQSRAAAGASNTRMPRIMHQHIVTTPCKLEYKSAVQRVMDDQAIARALSPKRAPPRTPGKVSKDAALAAAASADLAKNKAETLRREKEEMAKQLREEQCKERAERIRKEREEKAMRAQRRREQKEAEEKRKAELVRQREEKNERRREELRLQKSPARSKCPSRLASPARVQKQTTGDVRAAAKTLFPSTPGRLPTKMAKLTVDGETSKEPTMSTPSRDARRKPCMGKKERTASPDSMDDDFVPRQKIANHAGIVREERQRIMREERERQERLREEAEKRRLKLDEEERFRSEHPVGLSLKVELEEVVMADDEDEEETRRFNEVQKKCERMRLEKKRQEEELQRLKEIEKARLEAQRREEELQRLRAEQEKRIEEEMRRLREAAEREEQERKRLEEEQQERIRAEEEEALKRLNISSSAELQNRHLHNVSVNTPAVKRSPSNSSYELTPDKVFKPASENNYNIEDLSSGDETDNEDAPRKKVPDWAEGNQLRHALQKQAEKVNTGKFDPEAFFGEIPVPNLDLIFGPSKKYPRRGSSGVWDSPLNKPRQGVGAYRQKFNRH
ncbi:hypothetical protein Q1695_012728 [Nippostrongylus brasiliensis]|nr:hypothetical protein Q1695_012728 [Nippostrongylus brasiliensis]